MCGHHAGPNGPAIVYSLYPSPLYLVMTEIKESHPPKTTEWLLYDEISSVKELNILQALNVSSEMRGVKELEVLESGAKAWRLHSAFDHVQIPPNITYEFLGKLSDQLTIEFTYRQHRKTVASLMSVNSPGKMSPWLRLVSDTKRNKLLFDYRVVEDSKLHEIKFDLTKCRRLSKGDPFREWSRLTLSVSGTRAVLRAGCCRVSSPDKQRLAGHIYLQFPLDSLIYFRQEPGFKKKLLGAVQEATLANYARDPTWKCFT